MLFCSIWFMLHQVWSTGRELLLFQFTELLELVSFQIGIWFDMVLITTNWQVQPKPDATSINDRLIIEHLCTCRLEGWWKICSVKLPQGVGQFKSNRLSVICLENEILGILSSLSETYTREHDFLRIILAEILPNVKEEDKWQNAC